MTSVKEATKTIREWNLSYGWVVQWVLLILIGYMIAFGDSLYVRKAYLEKLVAEARQQRQMDLRALDTRHEAAQVREEKYREQFHELRILVARLEATARAFEQTRQADLNDRQWKK